MYITLFQSKSYVLCINMCISSWIFILLTQTYLEIKQMCNVLSSAQIHLTNQVN